MEKIQRSKVESKSRILKLSWTLILELPEWLLSWYNLSGLRLLIQGGVSPVKDRVMRSFGVSPVKDRVMHPFGVSPVKERVAASVWSLHTLPHP